MLAFFATWAFRGLRRAEAGRRLVSPGLRGERTFVVGWSRSRMLALGGLAAAAAGAFIAVSRGLGAATATNGVGGAQVLSVRAEHRTVSIDGAALRITTKPGGSVCSSTRHVSSCVSSLAGDQLSYATAHTGRRLVLAGVAGAKVKGVIARLSHRGTVWPSFHDGAFYAVIPPGYRLLSMVKVLADGRRVVLRI